MQQSDLPPAMLAVAEKMLHKVLYDAPAAGLGAAPAAAASAAVGGLVRPGAEELDLYIDVLLRQAAALGGAAKGAPTSSSGSSSSGNGGSGGAEVNKARMARVLDALHQRDALAARPAGAVVADDDQFLADNGHMIHTHALAASMARLRLLDVAWGFSLQAVGGDAESAALLTQMVAELRGVLAGYPDQYDAHKRLIGCLLVQVRPI